MQELLAESTLILRKYICVRHQNDVFFKVIGDLSCVIQGK